LFDALAISRAVPVTAFTQNPHHMSGYKRSRGFSGVFGETPSRRRLIMALMPATTPIPRTCSKSTVGYASFEGDSRTQVLKPRFSIVSRNSVNGPRFLSYRPDIPAHPPGRPRRAQSE